MAATETFPATILPGFGTRLKSEHRVLEAEFGDGYSQRAQDGLNAERETWSVIFDRISDTDHDTVVAFFDARKGSVEPFLWTAPRAAGTKQYVAKNIKIRPDNGITWTITATFQEVFDL